MNIVITGLGEHGKDTVSNMLTKHLPAAGSSSIACEIVVFPIMKERYGYKTHQECFDDRRNHRQEWYEIIKDYNKDDLSKFGKLIFEHNPIYNGIRNIAELKALRDKGIADTVIWVDASNRCPPESKTSMTIASSDCDYVLNNNGTLEQLTQEVIDMLCWIIRSKL